MTLTRVRLENFTAFAELDLELSPGINVLVGANGTGKTHLMKVCYAACDITRTGIQFYEKLLNVFLPSVRNYNRLIKGQPEGWAHLPDVTSYIEIHTKDKKLSVEMSTGGYDDGLLIGDTKWPGGVIESVYIPVKEMLSNAPGFRSLYAQREIHFEEVYRDILDRAFLPPLRHITYEPFGRLIANLQKAIGGVVVSGENEEFFLETSDGIIEFTLLAEGMRKLALLSILIQNGSLKQGSVLFWDEPETNLNPKMYGVVIDVLLELQRSGIQIFFATHDYVILKELDLQLRNGDEVLFHSLYGDEESGEIACRSTDSYLDIHPNAIAEAFDDLYDRQIERSLGNFGR